jgi:argininosuccinate lyase
MQERDKDPSVSLSWTLAKASTELLGAALEYDDAALAEMLSAKHFVEVRKTLGGPAPEETARASRVSRQHLEADETWWNAATEALAAAERRLAERSAAL